MRTLADLRKEHPHSAFESRPIALDDGLTHMVVLPSWYWEKLDLLLAVDCNSLAEITRFCQSLANGAVHDEGWEFQTAFRELFMYYIYRNYQGYLAVSNNLSNNNQDDCFKHLKD